MFELMTWNADQIPLRLDSHPTKGGTPWRKSREAAYVSASRISLSNDLKKGISSLCRGGFYCIQQELILMEEKMMLI